ncbi:helix-turn-helix domain-containing protein [Nostoc sp. NOS(2021)]|uniref:helix-turn-helix domain-containing protein n=1 Tax=Nostoc sp. NOS(2021) TaxID=2815407 RepID=UPI00345740E6
MPQTYISKTGNNVRVSFHTINRWENGRTRPSPLAMKQIEQLLHEMGKPGEALLAKYFQK